MEEGIEDRDVAFPADQQTSVVADPGDGALDLPPSSVSAKGAAVLMLALSGGEVRADEFDPSLLEPAAKGERIVPAVADEPIRVLPWPSGSAIAYSDCGERLGRELDLTRASAMDGNSQRNTLAVCQYHKLRSFALSGLADVETPFFAGAKVASMKHSLHRIRPRSLSSVRNVLQIRSQTPSSSQSLRRRQQVLGLGYSSGRSCQRAPVLRIQRIPSNTLRLSAQGRPRLRRRGSSGWIFSHCRSLRSAERLTESPSLFREHCTPATYMGLCNSF